MRIPRRDWWSTRVQAILAFASQSMLPGLPSPSLVPLGDPGPFTSPSTVQHSLPPQSSVLCLPPAYPTLIRPFSQWRLRSLETDPTSHHPFALAPPLFLFVDGVSLSLQLTCPFLYLGRSVLALWCFQGGGFGGGVFANFLFRTLDFECVWCAGRCFTARRWCRMLYSS
jgi:hypothetical protein